MLRIGMLTSGGDCQALNAAMRGVVKGLAANVKDLEVYGFFNGYKGLIYGNYRLLTSDDFSGILTKGGTILGSSREPFKHMRDPGENGIDKVEAMKSNYYKLNLDCIVILGGNGTQKTADLLRAMEQDSGIDLKSLKVDGGASANDFLMQFQADVINADTVRPGCIETTALGAAYLAGLAVGYWKDRAEIRANWKPDKTFVPGMDAGRREDLRKGWRRAVKCALAWAEE